MIVQIFGLPGTGKTTLAKEIVRRTNAVHINADDVRSDLSADLGFSSEDRVEQARRLGAISRLLSNQGMLVVVDFVNPTKETRESFGDADFTVFVDRITAGRFEDTNSIWELPESPDLVIPAGLSVEEEAELVLRTAGIHDWTKPTTLQLGRYQPWHEGHSALYDEGLRRTDQVLLGVRNTEGTSEKDPLPYSEVEKYIRQDRPNALIMKLPNITNIIYGRDVGYKIEKIELSQELQAISATQKRKEMGI
jgi:adenylylsulfate kinase